MKILEPVKDNRAGYQRKKDAIISTRCECGAQVWDQPNGISVHLGPCKIEDITK